MDEPAERMLRGLDKKTRRIIERHLLTLDYPYEASNIAKLQTMNGYRMRIGDYRALFLIDDDERAVAVIDVLPKGEGTYK